MSSRNLGAFSRILIFRVFRCERETIGGRLRRVCRKTRESRTQCKRSFPGSATAHCGTDGNCATSENWEVDNLDFTASAAFSMAAEGPFRLRTRGEPKANLASGYSSSTESPTRASTRLLVTMPVAVFSSAESTIISPSTSEGMAASSEGSICRCFLPLLSR
jgi:hypothetical protein